MNYRFQNIIGAPYRGGNIVVIENTQLISAVGNRVSITDLVKSQTSTLPIQSPSNICRLAASPSGSFLLTVDENNRCQFINVPRRVVLHRMTFKHAVRALKFSPDGKFIAAGTGKLIQIWRSPGFKKEVFAFELVRTITDCEDTVTALDWSSDGRHLLAGSKDLTSRVFCVEKFKGGAENKPFMLLGHKNAIVGCFFGYDQKRNAVTKAYTISRDCYILSWRCRSSHGESDEIGEENSGPPSPRTPDHDGEGHSNGRIESIQKKRKSAGEKNDHLGEDERYLHKEKWELLRKDTFSQRPAKLTACDYHRGLDMLVAGFQMELGQLLVWEWRSESHILRQQGHSSGVNCLCYSSDSQLLATGADDCKVKVWSVSSSFCIVTFPDHTHSITAVHFLANNNCLLSASLDGTVRAWDLLRYRNFRKFNSPRQLVSLTADPSGEIVCAGTLDSFQIFVWSMKTGKMLDVLSNHEGPVHGLMFSPTNAVLASSSWDKTVRIWDVFEGKGPVETFSHTHDVLAVAYRPDGKQLACSTLDGQIYFWDPVNGALMYTIEGRRDISGGRLLADRRSAANSTSGKCFTTLCYSADGSYILAGGNSKYICMYDVAEQVLLRRFQITVNRSLDGVLDFLNSKRMTDAGPLDSIDDDESGGDEGIDKQTLEKLRYDLPGTVSGRKRPVVRTKCLVIAPTGRCFAAATTEGVLVYAIDDNFIFDPTDLDMDVTPEAVDEALRDDQAGRALILSLRLNEDCLIKRCIFSVRPSDIPAAAAAVPPRYLQRLITALAHLLESCPHLEFVLRWCQELCTAHGDRIHQNSRDLLPALKSLQKAITRTHQDLAETCSYNEYALRYLCSTRAN